ncbi:efflux transporter outer membrane subunit [Thioalkalivibrio sp. XN279]|uniref:efflux transporter outer membrane subunit n=1 Tax=Thioalkalivibrio sp. XN279 TaxID=2714953 RepID=UPI00140771EE|nr:efflux transporter outer membrane subunit [Thioalkalivibrio sp. XN279]NHA13625.1 efflux transporter outer membrane subunit [Thioalkalivibrio sp. XN279]
MCKRRLLLLPLALILGACAVGPDYQRPELELPQAWPDALAVPASTAAEIQAWWRRFDDPVLDELIERALEDNLELHLGFARVQEARARVGLARAEQFPTVALQAEASRQRQPAAAIGLEGIEIPPRNVFSVSGVLSYELDLWGRLARSREAALAELERSMFAHEALRITLVADVVTGYYGLRSAQAQLDITRQTLASREENVRVQRLRYEAGMVDELVVMQSESDLATVRAQLPARVDAVYRRESALAILVGLDPAALVAGLDLGAPVEEPAAAGIAIPEVLPAELLARRPDLRAVEAGLEAATARVGVAMAARLPELDLAALVGTVAGSTGDLFSSEAESWRVGAAASGPLLDFGRGRAGVEIASALMEQAELQYRAAVTVAVAEVRDALRAYDNSLAAQRAVEDQVAALRRTEALADIRYREGYISIIELLDAQRGLLNAELLLAQSRADHYAATATLFKALGGGWEQSW